MSTTTPRGHGLVAAAIGVGANRKAATAIVFQGLIAGVLNTVAVQGDDGTIIGNQATALNTDNIIFNVASVYVNALGGGEIYVEGAGYNLAATWNVSVYIAVRGAGWTAILNYDAGGNCITFTGDNAKVRDLKIAITAGAGGGGTRPNCRLADTRTNIEVSGVCGVGDKTVVSDNDNLRQNFIHFDTVTEGKILNNKCENNWRHGAYMDASTENIVTDNTIETSLDGLYYHNGSDFNIIGNNTCIDNAGVGIRLTIACSGLTVTGNNCHRNDSDGIYLRDLSSSTVTGNVCTGNTGSGINARGTDNAISVNTCTGNTNHGIS